MPAGRLVDSLRSAPRHAQPLGSIHHQGGPCAHHTKHKHHPLRVEQRCGRSTSRPAAIRKVAEKRLMTDFEGGVLLQLGLTLIEQGLQVIIDLRHLRACGFPQAGCHSAAILRLKLHRGGHHGFIGRVHEAIVSTISAKVNHQDSGRKTTPSPLSSSQAVPAWESRFDAG